MKKHGLCFVFVQLTWLIGSNSNWLVRDEVIHMLLFFRSYDQSQSVSMISNILKQMNKKFNKNKTNSMLFPLFFSWIISILETFQELSNVILTFFIKIYPFRGKLTYKNVLFQDAKVENFNCEKLCEMLEKGAGGKLYGTILPFYATLWPDTAFTSNFLIKIGILQFLSLFIHKN